MCGKRYLVEVFDLGEQSLMGVSPRTAETTQVIKGPLQVVKCHGDRNGACGLIQLRQLRLAADEYSIESVGPQYEALYIRALQSHGASEDSLVFPRRGIQQ